jgi:hypothetical protein
MATGVIKSLKLDHDLVIVKLDGRSPAVALRVRGSDKRTVATLTPGQKIRFDLSCARDGRVFAIDVMPDTTLPREAADPDSSPPSDPLGKDGSNATDRRHFGKSVGGLRTGQYWMTVFEEGKRSVKDACRRSSVSAMMRHGGDSKGSVHYRAGGR